MVPNIIYQLHPNMLRVVCKNAAESELLVVLATEARGEEGGEVTVVGCLVRKIRHSDSSAGRCVTRNSG